MPPLRKIPRVYKRRYSISDNDHLNNNNDYFINPFVTFYEVRAISFAFEFVQKQTARLKRN